AMTIRHNTRLHSPTACGPTSAEAAQVTAEYDASTTTPKTAPKSQADFVGIGIHCAQGSALCKSKHARPDTLPDEPGGYSGFRALLGAKYVNPVIKPTGSMNVLSRNAILDQLGIGFS